MKNRVSLLLLFFKAEKRYVDMKIINSYVRLLQVWSTIYSRELPT